MARQETWPFATRSSVSDAVRARVEAGAPLALEDWRSGASIVVVDVVSPFAEAEGVREGFLGEFLRAVHRNQNRRGKSTLLATQCFTRMIAMSLLVLFTTGGTMLKARDACWTPNDFLNAPEQELARAVPCDLIGAAFLSGQGKHILYGERLPHDGRFQYYYVVRVFLQKNGIQNNYLDVNDTANLLAALSMLPDLEGPDMRRAAYYRGFILRQYLNVHGQELGEEGGMLNDLSSFLVGDGTFDRFSELDCFVRSDIPTVTIEAVLDSLRYQECVGASK